MALWSSDAIGRLLQHSEKETQKWNSKGTSRKIAHRSVNISAHGEKEGSPGRPFHGIQERCGHPFRSHRCTAATCAPRADRPAARRSISGPGRDSAAPVRHEEPEAAGSKRRHGRGSQPSPGRRFAPGTAGSACGKRSPVRLQAVEQRRKPRDGAGNDRSGETRRSERRAVTAPRAMMTSRPACTGSGVRTGGGRYDRARVALPQFVSGAAARSRGAVGGGPAGRADGAGLRQRCAGAAESRG